MASVEVSAAAAGDVLLVCNACQCTVSDDVRQEHYRSEWHRYNVKRRVNNLAPITQAVFLQKLAALNEQKVAGEAEKTAAKCNVCGNVFQSQKAYANHLQSKKHLKKLEKKAGASHAGTTPATPQTGPVAAGNAAAVPPVALNAAAAADQKAAPAVAASASASAAAGAAKPKAAKAKAALSATGAVLPVRKAVKPAANPDSKGDDKDDDADEGEGEGEDDDVSGYNPADALPLGSCLFCSKFFAAKPEKAAKKAAAAAAATAAAADAAKPADQKAAPAAADKPAAEESSAPKGDVEAALDHMAKAHGFFIPYVEYCTDVNGLMGYLGAKVGMGRVCLYCDGRGRSRYPTVQAVEQHMVAKGHCKIRFEENDVDEEVLDFYEFPDRDGGAEDDDDDAAAGAADSKAGALVLVDDGKKKAVASGSSSGAAAAPKRQAVTLNAHGELVLSDGGVIGHRDLRRVYNQNARPRETRESVLINRLMSSYKLLALPGYSASGVITPQMKRAQAVARAKQGAYNERVGTNSNLLIRKFFRVQTSL